MRFSFFFPSFFLIFFSFYLSDPKSSFVSTKRQNRVSKESILCGSENIGVQGKTIIEANAMIRGDLSTIEIGVNCVIGSGSIIRPAEQKIKGGAAFIPVTLGDFVLVEENCIIQAASIGSHVHIGANSVIGKRVILSNCCEIEANSVVTPGTVTPPFTVWGGNPAKLIKRLPDTYQASLTDYMKGFFTVFQPDAGTTTAPTK